MTVFSFRERPWEPPFFDAIAELSRQRATRFFEARSRQAASHADFWKTSSVDLILAVSWRYLIPPEIYRLARLGAFVFHDSLLPAYRGFSPTVWAMINGQSQTGVTLFEIAEEVDAGDIVDQLPVPIGAQETIADVLDRVTRAYLTLLDRNLTALLAGTAPRRVQDHSLATYTCSRDPADNLIDWRWPSTRILNLIRAVTVPYTGAFTHHAGQKLIVWAAAPLPSFPRRYVGSIPGKIVEVRRAEGSVVLTGDGALLLTRVQKEDGDPVCASVLLNSLACKLGSW